ncbi:uncharacterized protein TM35_000171950 [Trypanosoma theileri]|uniref:Uncharacterized protein n=1 Tax=Trypanosoma theileri TaxID=67003 RepID=A0A1X0NV06_9TRYP|nr:uncharacterized protein TM35_000171950 [Trypanosoma theileri]ORC88323.1 hypothetical protein TM35_000171950 [Trypanosoma theileri]
MSGSTETAPPVPERTKRETEDQGNQPVLERKPSGKKGISKISPFLQTQQDLQREMRCDYVLFWYERDPKTPPGQCPNFLRVGDPIRVSLSHHVFMQMAFGVLKDRLMKNPTRKKAKDNTDTTNRYSNNSDNPLGLPKEGKKNGPSSREQDTVALFCFLWQYVSSMLKSQAEAMRLVAAQSKKNTVLRPTVQMTKQQLRLQILLEYGIDVRQVLGDGLPTTGAVSDEYFEQLMTGSVAEEEFYNQLAKPSGMAQDCCIM